MGWTIGIVSVLLLGVVGYKQCYKNSPKAVLVEDLTDFPKEDKTESFVETAASGTGVSKAKK